MKGTSGRRCFFYFPLAILCLAGIGASGAQTRVAAAPDMTSLKSLGSRSARITVEVFSDFQCPACKRTYQDTLRPLIDNYVSSGKVYLVHHDFPLPMHNHSREAARWANAAAMIGKFEKVEEALYTKQETWGANGNFEAALAGVLTPSEMKKVRAILAQPAQIDAEIERDLALGKVKRVNQTPSLFVIQNGQTTALPPVGMTYPLLKYYLDFLLKQ